MNKNNAVGSAHGFFYVLLCGVIFATSILIIADSFHTPVAEAQAALSATWGVGGQFLPAPPPPFGDGDIFWASICGPLVIVAGPSGANWGTYAFFGIPYDYYKKTYPHYGKYMVGYAMANPSVICPPLLTMFGNSK